MTDMTDATTMKPLVLGIGIGLYRTDGATRFAKWCESFGYEYQIVGEGVEWRGGDMAAGPGGGHKINELLKVLNKTANRLIVICDTFDVIPVAGPDELIAKFNLLAKPHQIIATSELCCWPCREMAACYPKVETKYRYLNSGGLIGYRDCIVNVIGSGLKDTEDDQLFFTVKFLARNSPIILDYNCEIFQALERCNEDVNVYKNRAYNSYTKSYPIFLHGNGNSKNYLNFLENHLEMNPRQLRLPEMCTRIPEMCTHTPEVHTHTPEVHTHTPEVHTHTLEVHTHTPEVHADAFLERLDVMPQVFVALYVNSVEKSQQFDLFMKAIWELDLNNTLIHIYDQSQNLKLSEQTDKYTYHPNTAFYQFDDFRNSDCEYYFLLEQQCILTDKLIIPRLISYCDDYRRIVSPLLTDPSNTSPMSNFWGQVNGGGFYVRSPDYLDIYGGVKRGFWNAPHVCGAIMMHGSIIREWNIQRHNKFSNESGNRDMALTYNFRRLTLFMHSVNKEKYGYLAN